MHCLAGWFWASRQRRAFSLSPSLSIPPLHSFSDRVQQRAPGESHCSTEAKDVGLLAGPRLLSHSLGLYGHFVNHGPVDLVGKPSVPKDVHSEDLVPETEEVGPNGPDWEEAVAFWIRWVVAGHLCRVFADIAGRRFYPGDHIRCGANLHGHHWEVVVVRWLDVHVLSAWGPVAEDLVEDNLGRTGHNHNRCQQIGPGSIGPGSIGPAVGSYRDRNHRSLHTAVQSIRIRGRKIGHNRRTAAVARDIRHMASAREPGGFEDSKAARALGRQRTDRRPCRVGGEEGGKKVRRGGNRITVSAPFESRSRRRVETGEQGRRC